MDIFCPACENGFITAVPKLPVFFVLCFVVVVSFVNCHKEYVSLRDSCESTILLAHTIIRPVASFIV